MGLVSFHFLGSFLVFATFITPLASHPPNTDGFFLSDFFQKMGLNSTSSFNISAPVCSWKAAVCDVQNQSVISLVASGLGLSGSIPENTIAKLTNIQHLDLSSNYITDFSADFWSLGGTLISLNISFNQVHGSLPSNIGNFVQLKRLDLSYNGLSGGIPAAIGSLSSLQVLNLSKNSFVGTIPPGILDCKDLVSVDLSWNRLGGKVPSGFGAALQNLSALSLARNGIHGRLSDFSGLRSLAHLNLSSNKFHGAVVGAFEGPLKVIDLSQNQFHGHISQVHFNSSSNWASLVFLDLSENELSGEFFSDLNQAQSLEHLNLALNRFSEQRFPHVNKLLNLEYLNLSKTNLRGLIPTEILELGGLEKLDLSHNHLAGSVPDLSGNGNLQVLDLSHNNLTGEIPLHLVQKLLEMEKFDFSHNNVSLCAAKFSREMFMAAFSGAQDDCPIAANPALFRRNGAEHSVLMPALAIMFSVFFFLAGFICLTFACRRNSRLWAVKQLPVIKKGKNVSGSFSLQTDSTTWFADAKLATSVPAVVFNKPLLNFTFADLLSATSHFNRDALLAEGRFGPVYKSFLPGGVNAAIKVLVHGSMMTNEEIARELERLGRIKHPNLVPLIGYCIAGDQRIAIYEYMENGNLQNLLYDLPLEVQKTEDWSADALEEEEDSTSVRLSVSDGLTNWAFRHKIALGTARALSFLHHGCFPSIIHRDVKASSIYLGSSLEPRLSYFGLAKIVDSELDENELSMVSPGHSLEFSQSEVALATMKSDVYAFGVVLFELITGKKPVGDDYPDEKDSNLANWVRGLVRRNQGSKAVDPKIRGTGSSMQMEEALRIGYLCTADLPSKRPSMQQIVGLLKDIDPAPGL